MKVNEKVKMLRENRNLLQDDIAEAFDCDRSAIANYELGRRKIDLEAATRYAKYFNVSLDFLVDIDHVYGAEELRIIADDVFNSEAISEDDKSTLFRDIAMFYFERIDFLEARKCQDQKKTRAKPSR